MKSFDTVIVLGLDGLDPVLVEGMMRASELPHLSGLRQSGAFACVGTTMPAQTPVAWSTFATGKNPGGHGIFDFVRVDLETYALEPGLNRFGPSRRFLPPQVVNLRRGTPVWDLLGRNGVRSTVLRCPCTFPPDKLRGRMLSGMGVPDVRGSFGTGTFYTTAENVQPRESEQVVRLESVGQRRFRTYLVGPRSAKTGEDVRIEALLTAQANGTVRLSADGASGSLLLSPDEWSEWLKVKFRTGPLQSIHAMIRFHLVRYGPEIEVYASPANFDPQTPAFPISEPWDYAGELERELGSFYTTGMIEDHAGLNNQRFDEEVFLAQCDSVFEERRRMLEYELEREPHGFIYCLFDTPDRVQHMFWRYREAGHPANAGRPPEAEMTRVIEDHYRKCDTVVGDLLEFVDDRTLLVVLSDHGFESFERGVHLNSWLREQGHLALANGVEPGPEAEDYPRHVDWSQTRAYASGLGGIRLNLAGREAEGIVAPADAGEVKSEIVNGLTGLFDPHRREVAVRRVIPRETSYSGPYVDEAPDLVVLYARGYRASWSTGWGGVPIGLFEDNVRKWSGDHVIDPTLVPGVLFMNRHFEKDGARLEDLAPTILAAFGVEIREPMEGESLLT